LVGQRTAVEPHDADRRLATLNDRRNGCPRVWLPGLRASEPRAAAPRSAPAV